MSSRKPPFDTDIATHTAEAMALPQMVCRRRGCRRRRRCRRYFTATGEPCCLSNLDPAQRAIFDRIYLAAHLAKHFLGSDSDMFETKRGPQRLLDDLAIAIARNVQNRWFRAGWDTARRAREKRMAAADRLACED